MAQVNPGAKDYDPERIVSNLLRERLKPFNVPNEILVALREDIVAALSAPQSVKSGRGAVMTPSASLMGDKLRRGENVDPSSARPTQI